MTRKPEFSRNAERVLRARYLLRDHRGKVVETPTQLFHRVAAAIGKAGKRCDGKDRTDEYRAMLTALDFLPNSPTLMNAGSERTQLSACYVLPVEDTLEDIFEVVKRMALIQRDGGGTGFSFSHLRPRGAPLRKTGGEASGPVSFLRIFDSATEHVRQGGRRRGANMGVLRVDHPDIYEFVRLKLDGSDGRNFNLSVAVTDEFMEAVEDDGRFVLWHESTGSTGTASARKLFEMISKAAWECGDPGLLFLDAINRANPTPRIGAIEATNPCGEVPLLPYEACNLGSINLARMLDRGGVEPAVDWDKLERTVRLAIRFLDDVIEANTFPFEEIDHMVRGNRKVGLGVMGFAEMLIRLEIPYDSDEAVRTAESVMRFIAETARSASEGLAGERGSFPNWAHSIHQMEGRPMRNATCCAIAPTGSIGLIAGTSAGIEPFFALAWQRRHSMGGGPLREVQSLFLERMRRMGALGRRLVEEVREAGSLAGSKQAPEELRRLYVTASEIPFEWHLAIQAAFQRWVDNSVSKTVNLRSQATPEEVERIFLRAWKLGLKGTTVFRSGCRREQVIELGTGCGLGSRMPGSGTEENDS